MRTGRPSAMARANASAAMSGRPHGPYTVKKLHGERGARVSA
jgi:hypothetical protein